MGRNEVRKLEWSIEKREEIEKELRRTREAEVTRKEINKD